MKVKVIKANLSSYWYADRIGQEYDVVEIQLDNRNKFEYKVIGSELVGTKYFDKDDVEGIKEDRTMFDIKKDKWFIYTPTPEISKVVQRWLFAQGFVWQHFKDAEIHCTDSRYLKLSPSEDDAFCHTDTIDPKYDKSKEIKLTFKTIVDSVEYPETQTPEQKQLQEVMTKISELQEQAEKLQGLINK